MKTIQLKAAKEMALINNSMQEVILTTVDLLKITINKVSQDGYNIEQIMQRLKILGIINPYVSEFNLTPETENEVLKKVISVDIEDADYAELSKWVKGMKWTLISQFIVDFVQSFN